MSYSDVTYILNSNPLFGVILGAVLGTIFGAPASFAISAVFADNFAFPNPFRKRKTFKPGKYRLYAPSRESAKPIICWDMNVNKKRFFLVPKVVMSCVWLSNGAHRRSYWEYYGSIVTKGQQIVFKLNTVTRKSDEIVISGETLNIVTSVIDTTFILMHEETAAWGIRPCVVAGYDTHGRCYGGVGIIVNQEHDFSDEDADSVLNSDAFLGYDLVRKRLEEHQFPTRK